MDIERRTAHSARDVYRRRAIWYDLSTKPIELFLLRKARRALAASVYGKILEVGVGTGANFVYYPHGLALTGIDASPEMLRIAREKAKLYGLSADLREMDAETLQFPDGSFDTVVSTLMLCTVANPVQAVREMKRVCKKNGRLIFLEHGKSSVRWVACWQARRAKRHLEKHACNVLREPFRIAEQAGLRIQKSRRFFFGIFHYIEAAP